MRVKHQLWERSCLLHLVSQLIVGGAAANSSRGKIQRVHSSATESVFSVCLCNQALFGLPVSCFSPCKPDLLAVTPLTAKADSVCPVCNKVWLITWLALLVTKLLNRLSWKLCVGCIVRAGRTYSDGFKILRSYCRFPSSSRTSWPVYAAASSSVCKFTLLPFLFLTIKCLKLFLAFLHKSISSPWPQ